MKFKRFGPFRYFTVKATKGYSAWLDGCEEHSHGFEWGDREKPIISLRLGPLTLLYLDLFSNGGFEVAVLGFWWIQ